MKFDTDRNDDPNVLLKDLSNLRLNVLVRGEVLILEEYEITMLKTRLLSYFYIR